MDLTDLKDWLDASKTAVDLLKSAYGAMPKGGQRQEIETKVQIAEDILHRSDAKLAKELGYELCQCTFPPQIMLWREAEQAHVCPNQSCGRKVVETKPVVARLPGGPNSWMGR